MSYIPINVTADTLITPSLLRYFETQYDLALQFAQDNIRQNSTEPITPQIEAVEPVGAEGNIYFNSVTGLLYFYDGDWRATE